MEWPAPQPLASPSPFAPPSPAAPPAGPTPSPIAPPMTPTLPETDEPKAAHPAPFAPRVIAASTAPLLAKPATAPTQPAAESVIHDPFAPAWPGTAAGSATTNPRRLDGRKLAPLLAGGVVLISIITIGIFLAVRVGKNPDETAPEIVAGRPMRPNGPARLAAEAMKKSFESLARGCDLEVPRGADADVWLFSAAYAQCGTRIGAAFPPPGLRVDQPRAFDANAPTNAPPNAATNSLDDDAPDVNTPRQTNPGRGGTFRPAPAPAPAPSKPPASDGCVDKCSANQRQCNRACGSEPTSSTGYDRWQGCQTQCLSAASKCRLACQ